MNNYYSGQGSLYVATRSIVGVPLGFMRLGNVPELTIDIATTIFEHKESESGVRGIDLTITKENKGSFAFKMENLSLDTLAMGLYGTKSSVIAGTVTAGAPDIVKLYWGKRSPLAHPDVSNVVVKSAIGGTIYDVTDDYLVDAKNGILTGVSSGDGGAIANATDVYVSYDYAAVGKLDAFMVTAPERWLRFQGLNTVDGTSVLIDIFRAKFDPLTGYSLINDELASASMKGTALADEFRLTGSKYFRQQNLAA